MEERHQVPTQPHLHRGVRWVKLYRSGRQVPTRKVKPTQTCPKCGHQHPKTLDERIHNRSKGG